MNVTRLIALAVVVLSLGVGVMGWFLGISPILTQADSADRQTTLVRTENANQAAVLAQLKSDYDQIDDAVAALELLEAEVPDRPLTDGIAARVAELQAATSVMVVSATFGEAAPYGGASDPTASVEAELLGVSSGLAARLFVVPVTISVRGTADAVMAFLAGMQGPGRVVFLSTAAMTSDEGAFVIDMSGYAYVVVDPETIAADAAEKVEAARDPESGAGDDDSAATPAPAPEPTPTETPAP